MSHKQRKILSIGVSILFGLIWYLLISKTKVNNTLALYFLIFMDFITVLFAYFMPYIVHKNAGKLGENLINPYKVSRNIGLVFGSIGLLIFIAKESAVYEFKNSDIISSLFILFCIILCFICYFKPFSSIKER